MKKLLPLLLTLMFLGGCATKASNTFIAKDIDISNKNSYSEVSGEYPVFISQVDGKGVFRLRIGKDATLLESAKIAPGHHKLMVKYKSSTQYAYGCVWLDTVAGQDYIIKTAITEKNRAMFWVENATTNEKIGGALGTIK